METNTERFTIRILNFITMCSKEGVTFTQIQKELWSYTHLRPFTRVDRGWWCTNLLGSPYNHSGLLHTFCEKRNGKWYRNNVQYGKHPWTCVSKWKPTPKVSVKESVCPTCGK